MLWVTQLHDFQWNSRITGDICFRANRMVSDCVKLGHLSVLPENSVISCLHIDENSNIL